MIDVQHDSLVDEHLWQRACGEYLEMPGLQLTAAQAARLWNVPLATSQQLLDALVDAAFLRRRGDCYVRVEGGRGPY
jgi:hypothetical protein